MPGLREGRPGRVISLSGFNSHKLKVADPKDHEIKLKSTIAEGGMVEIHSKFTPNMYDYTKITELKGGRILIERVRINKPMSRLWVRVLFYLKERLAKPQ